MAAAVALTLLLPASVLAARDSPGERPLASSNVEPLATLPVPNPIGPAAPKPELPGPPGVPPGLPRLPVRG